MKPVKSKRLNDRRSIVNDYSTRVIKSELDQLQEIEDGDLTALYLDAKPDTTYYDSFKGFCDELLGLVIERGIERLTSLVQSLLDSKIYNIENPISRDLVNLLIQEIEVLEMKKFLPKFSTLFIKDVCFKIIDEFSNSYFRLMKEEVSEFQLIVKGEIPLEVETKKKKSYFSTSKKKETAKDEKNSAVLLILAFEKKLRDCCELVNSLDEFYELVENKLWTKLESTCDRAELESIFRSTLSEASHKIKSSIDLVIDMLLGLSSVLVRNALESEENENLFEIMLATLSDYLSKDCLQSWLKNSIFVSKVVFTFMTKYLVLYIDCAAELQSETNHLKKRLRKDKLRLFQFFQQYLALYNQVQRMQSHEDLKHHFQIFEDAIIILTSRESLTGSLISPKTQNLFLSAYQSN